MHPNLKDTKEAEILNSIKISSCPYCDSKAFTKKGLTSNGVQRFLCKKCNRRFTPTTRTIFEDHKISISEWIEFLLDIFSYGSTNLVAKVNKNSRTTSIYWLHKIFIVLKNYQQNIVLSGDVYIDEICYKVIISDVEKKDGKELRGQSRNQFCIGLGYDGTRVIAIIEGRGKTSSKKTLKAFITHIKESSKLIHDEEKSHNELIAKLNLVSESYNSEYLKGLPDKENPLNPINQHCRLVKQFLNSHSGFNREDLQDYLNLYCFISNGYKNNLEKVLEFLTLALQTRTTLKYRTFYKE